MSGVSHSQTFDDTDSTLVYDPPPCSGCDSGWRRMEYGDAYNGTLTATDQFNAGCLECYRFNVWCIVPGGNDTQGASWTITIDDDTDDLRPYISPANNVTRSPSRLLIDSLGFWTNATSAVNTTSTSSHSSSSAAANVTASQTARANHHGAVTLPTGAFAALIVVLALLAGAVVALSILSGRCLRQVVRCTYIDLHAAGGRAGQRERSCVLAAVDKLLHANVPVAPVAPAGWSIRVTARNAAGPVVTVHSFGHSVVD